VFQARDQAAQQEYARLKEAQVNAAKNACAAMTYPGFSSYLGVVQVAIGPMSEHNQWCAVTLPPPPLPPHSAAASSGNDNGSNHSGASSPLLFQRVTGNLLRDEAAAAREYDISVKGRYGPSAITNFVQRHQQQQQQQDAQPGEMTRNAAAIVPAPSCLEEVCV
jgi:hypothetical protein